MADKQDFWKVVRLTICAKTFEPYVEVEFTGILDDDGTFVSESYHLGVVDFINEKGERSFGIPLNKKEYVRAYPYDENGGL